MIILNNVEYKQEDGYWRICGIFSQGIFARLFVAKPIAWDGKHNVIYTEGCEYKVNSFEMDRSEFICEIAKDIQSEGLRKCGL